MKFYPESSYFGSINTNRPFKKKTCKQIFYNSRPKSKETLHVK